MGQVHVQVVLTNYREALLAQLGQFPPDRVHRYETVAYVDTRVMRSIIPPSVAARLGLIPFTHAVRYHPDGSQEKVDVAEAMMVAMLGRETAADALVYGEDVLIGMTVLTGMDLVIDPTHKQVITNPAHPHGPVFLV